MPFSSEKVYEQEDMVKKRSEQIFSSEKREDIWAIVLASIIFLLSIIWPEGIYRFFTKTLFLF